MTPVSAADLSQGIAGRPGTGLAAPDAVGAGGPGSAPVPDGRFPRAEPGPRRRCGCTAGAERRAASCTPLRPGVRRSVEGGPARRRASAQAGCAAGARRYGWDPCPGAAACGAGAVWTIDPPRCRRRPPATVGAGKRHHLLSSASKVARLTQPRDPNRRDPLVRTIWPGRRPPSQLPSGCWKYGLRPPGPRSAAPSAVEAAHRLPARDHRLSPGSRCGRCEVRTIRPSAHPRRRRRSRRAGWRR